MTAHIRFRPPTVRFSPELRWVLLRAFGPLERTCVPDLNHARAAELARLLNLGGRLAARLGRERLALELGTAQGAVLWRSHQVSVGRLLHRTELAHAVADAARQASCEVAYLKSAALHLAGITAAGTRDMADVDVLVDRGRRAAFEDALRSVGFRSMELRSRGESAAGLFMPSRGTVDLHLRVPGLRLTPGAAFAELADLREAGFLVPAPGLGPGLSIPVRSVLAAQTLAHGIGGHGFDPAHYPLLRMVADLVDLGLGGEEGETLVRAIIPWLQNEVSAAEVSAARELCALLATGDPELFSPQAHDRPAVKLLRHILAGAVDPRYQRALRLHALVPGLRSDRSLGFILRAGWRHTFRPREDMELLWGPPTGRFGYLGRRFGDHFRALRDAAGYRIRRGIHTIRGHPHQDEVRV